MSIFKRLNYFMIRHNKKWFDKWIYNLENRVATCGGSDIVYVLESLTIAKVHRMDDERLKKVNSILSFHCSFDEIHLKRILYRYTDKVGTKKAKKFFKALSYIDEHHKNVFIKDIISLYLHDNTFVDPTRLTVC